MALSINWLTKVIFVPQADLVNLGGGIYELDVDAFRLELKDLEDDETGQVFPATHQHNTEVTLSGVTYARTFEIINGYTIEFENGSYTVKCVGANHNIGDVKVVNSVSLLIGNSAGLIVVGGGGGGAGDTKEDIYTYFTTSSRQDTFKADVSGLVLSSELPANFSNLLINPSGHISRVTLVDTVTGLGGSPVTGIVRQITCIGDDNLPLENVTGWLTSDFRGYNAITDEILSDVNGNLTFLLDAGEYFLWRSHPSVAFKNPAYIVYEV